MVAADPLVVRGHHVTTGAAPGYVADALCGSCHAELYESYRDVGMARSFYRPRSDNLIEDFSSDGFFHAPSRRHYRMVRRDDRLFMRRHQLDAAGEPIHQVEQEVAWILGSGNHSRTYLYRTPWGELYQLPIAWYTQSGSWGMAPGFDRPGHLGLARLLRRECLFCHNAYPEMPAGSDAHNQPQRFPEDLPEGVGCQRCHGPGAAHARAAMREPVDFERVYATIVNPADLPRQLRDDVCYGCHMQPTVAIPGKRRFGRADFSFRPGEPLSDYLVAVDVVEAGRDRGERFEINHHPYRLEQSRCYTASSGELSCLTCHDPHRKVPPTERAAHYRVACLGCHEVDACRLDEMAVGTAAAETAADDCAACHMPKRRTQDVVRVTMTDHRILRRPAVEDPLAELDEVDPEIDDVLLLDPARGPEGLEADLYRAYTLVELTGGRHAVSTERLEALLPVLRPPELEPYLALAQAALNQRRLETARNILESILERSPDYPKARELLGIVHAGLGNREQAVGLILEAVERGQDRPEARFNLGLFLTKYERFDEALPHLERAVEMRPTMHQAWLFLAEAQLGLGRADDAERSYRRAAALEPRFDRAYLALGRLLLAQGRREEALRIWRHGAEHAARPQAIAEALAQAEAEGRARTQGGGAVGAAPAGAAPAAAEPATRAREGRARAASRR
jgi:Flp pilus assembly protein TadD